MKKERNEKYIKLESEIGKTSLVQYLGEVPRENKIWIKRECDNPFGSHYDRVYLALFKHFEETGLINERRKVFETSSGTAGASFAGIGRELGYECHVAIPKGVDEAVINVIKGLGAEIYFTPEKDYVSGFPEFIKKFKPWDKGMFFLNHSMGRRGDAGYVDNNVTLSALGEIAEEIVSETNVDIYIPAIGNGSSLLGPGKVFKRYGTRIVGFESAQSGVAYDKLYPGKYLKELGINIGELPRHNLRGTSYPGIDFPHIRNAVEQGILDEVVLVSDEDVDASYFSMTGKRDTEKLVHWDGIDCEFGKSTRAGIAVGLDIASKVEGKNIIVIAYDFAKRYD